MGETDIEKKIVINDLLSFLICKHDLVPREKLLHIIGNYYSECDINEAQRTLLSALPVKKSTRHGRRVKHPDPLVAIYDCIQLIPKEELPTFVCKNLNNIPNLNNMKKTTMSKEEEEVCSDFQSVLNNNEIDEALCRKEQKVMRSQITEMFSIITELKGSLQKYIETHKITCQPEEIDNHLKAKKINFSKPEPIIVIKNESSPLFQSDLEDNDGTSTQDGLALLQKLIDEDDQTTDMDMADKEDIYSEDDPDDFDSIEHSGDLEYTHIEKSIKTESLNEELAKSQSLEQVNKAESPCQEQTLVAPSSEEDHKVIYIKTELVEAETETREVADMPQMSTEIESSVEISTTVRLDGQGAETEDVMLASCQVGSSDPHERLVTSNVDVMPKSEERTKIKNGPRQCPGCSDVFRTYFELRMHCKQHILKCPYECVLCNASFTKRDDFLDHFFECFEKKKQINELNGHFCQVCGSFFAEMNALESHVSVHSEGKSFSCDQCTYRFFNEAALHSHVKFQHNPLNTFSCHLCPLKYISKNYLLAHLRAHTGERPYKCSICSYRASDRSSIKKHIWRHAGPETLKCGKCDFSALGMNKMIRHRQKSHMEPLTCPICGKTFRTCFIYKRHYKTHSKPIRFRCNLCLFRSQLRETFQKHLKIHSDKSGITCPDCQIPLLNKRSIEKHIRNFCTSNPYLKKKPKSTLKNDIS